MMQRPPAVASFTGKVSSLQSSRNIGSNDIVVNPKIAINMPSKNMLSKYKTKVTIKREIIEHDAILTIVCFRFLLFDT